MFGLNHAMAGSAVRRLPGPRNPDDNLVTFPPRDKRYEFGCIAPCMEQGLLESEVWNAGLFSWTLVRPAPWGVVQAE